MQTMQKNIVIFPIGGVRSIGANCTMYYFNEINVIVDYGVGLSSIDVYTPYDAYIYNIVTIEKYFRFSHLNLVLTHIHEDHIGGISYLVDNMSDNIKLVVHLYGELALEVLKSKLSIEQISKIEIVSHELYTTHYFDVSKKFSMQFFPVDHSVPEACGVLLDINKYVVFHSGDWNIKHNIEKKILRFTKFADVLPTLETIQSDSIKTFIKLRNKCHLVVGESTKIGESNHKITEEEVLCELDSILKKNILSQYNRVFITCFASQIERIASLINLCIKKSLTFYVFGRGIQRIMLTTYFKNTYAQYYKYVKFISSYRELQQRKSGIYLVSGSQNEYNSVLYQLINYNNNFFNSKDLVIFASPIIPGAYKQIEMITDSLIYQKVSVMNVMINKKLHASGHAVPEEIKFKYRIMQPAAVLPVHGNAIKIKEHVNLVKKMGIMGVNLNYCFALVVQWQKQQVFKLSKIKLPDDMVNLYVKINTMFIPQYDNVVTERRAMLQGGILVLNVATKNIVCAGSIVDRKIVKQIENDIVGIDLNLKKNRLSIIKMAKTKWCFYGLVLFT